MNIKNTLMVAKAVSLFLAGTMMLSLTACGSDSPEEDAGLPTESNPTITEGPGIDEPAMPIDPGADFEITSTTEPAEESNSKSETAGTESTNGTYTYDVDGVEITLRTNLDNYIWVSKAGFRCVNFAAIAKDIGYYYDGAHPDDESLQMGFHCNTDPNTDVYFGELGDNGNDFYEVCYSVGTNGTLKVHFARYDIDDDSVDTYHVLGSGSNYSMYHVNFEQIVIFTYFLENGVDDPDVYWIETSGISVSSKNTADYYVVK